MLASKGFPTRTPTVGGEREVSQTTESRTRARWTRLRRRAILRSSLRSCLRPRASCPLHASRRPDAVPTRASPHSAGGGAVAGQAIVPETAVYSRPFSSSSSPDFSRVESGRGQQVDVSLLLRLGPVTALGKIYTHWPALKRSSYRTPVCAAPGLSHAMAGPDHLARTPKKRVGSVGTFDRLRYLCAAPSTKPSKVSRMPHGESTSETHDRFSPTLPPPPLSLHNTSSWCNRPSTSVMYLVQRQGQYPKTAKIASPRHAHLISSPRVLHA